MTTQKYPRQSKTRVVVVEDHPVMREGTRSVLQQTPDIDVVGVAENGETALRLAKELQPDVLVLDVRLPDMSGIEVAKRVRASLPNVGILVLTGYDDVGYFRALMRLGVHGYLRKTASAEEIVQAVRDVAAGSRVFAEDDLSWPSLEKPGALTEREYDVLRLLVAGQRNGEIGEELSLTLKTVEFHVSNVLRKLGARSRAQAVGVALEQRLVSPGQRPAQP